MRHHRLACIAAVATTISVAPFSPLTANAAAAAPAGAIAPAEVTTPVVVRHVNTDVDGDGTRDSVDLTYLGADQFTLSAVTTKGRSASVSFRSHVNPGMVPAADTFYGADAIDGRNGSELIVHLYGPNVTDSGQNLDVAVYTWRSGALVAEPAPAARTGTGWEVGLAEGAEAASGYRFFTSHGHRYVDTSRLVMAEGPWRYEGSVTRSVWRGGKWAKVSTRGVRTKSMPEDLTWGQVGMAGPKLLLSQVKADISGDRRTDLALFYQVGRQRYRATVLAHGRRASADVTYQTFPFIGATAVDDRAGAELIANSGAGHRWTVLAWRHSGKLVGLKGPALYGGVGNREWRAAAEATTNFSLSVEQGRHYVTTGWIDDQDSVQTDPVHFAKSVWKTNKWQKLSEWSAVLTDAQRAAFHQGFTAPGLVTP
jgi:hypothetical protein